MWNDQGEDVVSDPDEPFGQSNAYSDDLSSGEEVFFSFIAIGVLVRR